MSAGTGAVVAAIVSGVFVLTASMMGRWLSARVRRLEASLDQCLRERQALRRNLQLVVGAIVGLIPEPQRLALLRTIDESVPPYSDAA